jgi:hypothetical protein
LVYLDSFCFCFTVLVYLVSFCLTKTVKQKQKESR